MQLKDEIQRVAIFLTFIVLLCWYKKLVMQNICYWIIIIIILYVPWVFFKQKIILSLVVKSSEYPVSRLVDRVSHPLIILTNTHLTAQPRLAWTSATVPSEWCRIAATYHSLNGLIISANPASFPLSFCQVTGQLMAEKLRYLSSFNQAPSHATAQPGRKKSVSSDVKSFNFYRAIRGFITAERCQDSLRLSNS